MRPLFLGTQSNEVQFGDFYRRFVPDPAGVNEFLIGTTFSNISRFIEMNAV